MSVARSKVCELPEAVSVRTRNASDGALKSSLSKDQVFVLNRYVSL